MSGQEVINKTIKYMKLLPEDKIEEIADFVEFIYNKYEEEIIGKGIHKLSSESDSFKFLEDEEDLYSLSDLKSVK